MSASHWHKRYHSDALTGFMSLTLEERGAYQTVLDMIYDRGGPIVDNDRLLAGYMGVSVRKWLAIKSVLIAKQKIEIVGGHVSAADFSADNLAPENRPPLSRWLRHMVIERDGEVCAYCGHIPEIIEIDHVLPVALGGGDDLDNLAVSCRPCNRSKGMKLISEWLQ